MPNALIVSDLNELSALTVSALSRDLIHTKVIDWNPIRHFRIKPTDFDYLVLIINFPNKQKTKLLKSIINKTNAKVVLSTINNSLDNEFFDVARKRNIKIIFYDQIVDLEQNNLAQNADHCVKRDDLALEIVNNLYGFADHKIIYLGEKRDVSNNTVAVIPQNALDKKVGVKLRAKYRKIVFGLLLMLLPYVLLASVIVPSGGAYIGYKYNRYGLMSNSLILTSRLSNIGQKVGGLYTRIPLVGVLYQKPLSYVNAARDASNLIILGLSIADDGEKLIKNLTGNGEYDLEQISSSLATNIDTMYRKLSFFEAEIDQLNPWIDRRFNLKIRISQYRPILQGASLFSSNLYNTLGGDKSKTYLVLFQNNMELRPTGGFIGSIGLLTLDKGKLIDFNVYDVYDADGQLKGYIEPPEPIAKYLGEESWYLRDSNWDPDFPSSAMRAEWFLDKSLQRQIDGVIAINLEVAKSILDVTGPVELDGYGGAINKDNLYEKVQYEVEENFFPGSRKKKNYLTALAKALVGRLETADSKQVLALVKQLSMNANALDIQAYFNDAKAQEGMSVLGWSGKAIAPECEDDCYVDWLRLIEANVGVNKANYNVERSADLLVELNENYTKNTLYIKYVNTSGDTTRIPETRYKNYLRLLVPLSAEVGDVKLMKNDKTIEILPEIVNKDSYKEIGSLVEIEPSETVTVVYTWIGKYENIHKLLLSWDKQSGVTMPITIRFKPPQNLYLRPTPAFNLTEEQFVGYNSVLSSQFKSLIVW